MIQDDPDSVKAHESGVSSQGNSAKKPSTSHKYAQSGFTAVKYCHWWKNQTTIGSWLSGKTSTTGWIWQKWHKIKKHSKWRMNGAKIRIILSNCCHHFVFGALLLIDLLTEVWILVFDKPDGHMTGISDISLAVWNLKQTHIWINEMRARIIRSACQHPPGADEQLRNDETWKSPRERGSQRLAAFYWFVFDMWGCCWCIFIQQLALKASCFQSQV